MRKISIAVIATLAAVIVSGCNTVKGVGRDIESVGRAGEDAINSR